MNKIRKGDQVIVLTGRDKGKRGTVLSRTDDERIVVDIGIAEQHNVAALMTGLAQQLCRFLQSGRGIAALARHDVGRHGSDQCRNRARIGRQRRDRECM